MRIAVLGMGRMGQALAARLLDGGHRVTVWNRSRGKAAELVDRGAQEATDLAAAVSGAEVVMTCLATDEAVREVALGPDGFHDVLGGDAVYVDASTVSPALTEELDGRFERFVAMPVLGNPDAVRKGDASVLVGGPEELAETVAPMVSSLTSAVHSYPRAPLATAAKLTANLLLLDGVVALAESLSVGRAGGLTDDQLEELLAESPMVAPGIRNRFDAVLSGAEVEWWSLELGAKDARLALELAGWTDLPLSAAGRQQYERAVEEGLADHDLADVAVLYRQAP